MRQEFFYDSCGKGKIRACMWIPEGKPTAVVQIVHGIAEHVERYEDYASWLNDHGILMVAEDHMGHGKSVGIDGIQGYFHGGWFAAVADTWNLLQQIRNKYPDLPYFLFGHSMGSFIARTILTMHPDSGISGCIICGTAWQPGALLKVAQPLSKFYCRNGGDKKPCEQLKKLMFGSYNKRVEHVRSENDWLTRDDHIVDLYNRDPLCGFTATAGLYRDMLIGIAYIQKKENLAAMNKNTPVLYIAGGDDPVGAYGKGVEIAAKAFRKAGMVDVSLKLYPLCRHEILNEINNIQVYEDTLNWINEKCKA